MTPLFQIEGLTKAYPGVVANDDVSFSIGKGEVHALLGENGAGKSTLVKMIYGLVRPDSGTMRFEDASYTPASPHEARQAGIAMGICQQASVNGWKSCAVCCRTPNF